MEDLCDGSNVWKAIPLQDVLPFLRLKSPCTGVTDEGKAIKCPGQQQQIEMKPGWAVQLSRALPRPFIWRGQAEEQQ